MYKNYNWSTLKRHSAYNVLMRLSECNLYHFQDMQLFRFYSVTASH